MVRGNRVAVEHEKSRVKRTFTTKRKRLEQDLEHVTQEMYRKNLELVSTNRTLSLLRAIDSMVLESQSSLGQLAQQITDSVSENSNFTHVAIFSKVQHRRDLGLVARTVTETPQPVGETTPPTKTHETVLPNIMLDADSSWFKTDQKEIGVSVAGDMQGLHKVGLTATSFDQLFSAPLKSIYVIKLRARDQLVGCMIIGFGGPFSSVSDGDIELLGRLGNAVGVAIDNRLLYEENQEVLQKLQKTNVKLRALDEAKDEFIGMASHQLRTPLTSVKGYVSMVIDGDAGKLSKQQSELLGQAYASSQRMVYLIADLLNVSRLKTGKFVIENKPTQLAEVVETEMQQLQDMAKTKEQTLTFAKPKSFPTLMLDETKIRQVIMNFTDNALHYTPNKGHITVSLEDVGDSITFKVVDDGLGVPKEEQRHLFTKFYRADNAKKARPDGTGLGLFMAKKVIVAQGGAVIFTSEENKGSTFGFTFPKKALQASKKA